MFSVPLLSASHCRGPESDDGWLRNCWLGCPAMLCSLGRPFYSKFREWSFQDLRDSSRLRL